MSLSAEDRNEVKEIVESVVRVNNIDLPLLQQQWKKFKEAPEARLAALEVRVEGLGFEIKGLKEEMERRFAQVDQRFEQMDKRFEQMDKRFETIDRKFDHINDTLLKLHESMNAQVWKFLGGLGVILILLRLAGAIFPSLP